MSSLVSEEEWWSLGLGRCVNVRFVSVAQGYMQREREKDNSALNPKCSGDGYLY